MGSMTHQNILGRVGNHIFPVPTHGPPAELETLSMEHTLRWGFPKLGLPQVRWMVDFRDYPYLKLGWWTGVILWKWTPPFDHDSVNIKLNHWQKIESLLSCSLSWFQDIIAAWSRALHSHFSYHMPQGCHKDLVVSMYLWWEYKLKTGWVSTIWK